MTNTTKISVVLVLSLVLTAVSSCAQKSISTSSDSDEALEVNKVVEQAYRGLSFSPNQKADFDLLDRVFIERAIFRSFRSGKMDVFYKEEYFSSYQKTVESGQLEAVVEKEIWGNTQVFGKIAQRLSSYVMYYNDLETPAERGVNSFQLVKTDKGWQITSVIYDVERSTLPIPNKFLSK